MLLYSSLVPDKFIYRRTIREYEFVDIFYGLKVLKRNYEKLANMDFSRTNFIHYNSFFIIQKKWKTKKFALLL